MNQDTSQLILSLQEYITELEEEIKALKSHIYLLQSKLATAKQSYHDEQERLRLYNEQL